MPRTKKTIEADISDDKEVTLEEQIIDDFVEEHDNLVEMMGYDTNIPVTVRLNKMSVAVLDNLTERWQSNRSNMAAELLEKMIWLVFRKVYKEKTNDELSQFQIDLYKSFMNKKETKKARKNKKENQ